MNRKRDDTQSHVSMGKTLMNNCIICSAFVLVLNKKQGEEGDLLTLTSISGKTLNVII